MELSLEKPDRNTQRKLWFHSFVVGESRREVSMDRCPQCHKRMKPVLGVSGRTEFQCLQCDKVDPLKADAGKSVENPLAQPTKAA
jgi:tRNA(Ile2) C34 agmatinyltransferase TiaS